MTRASATVRFIVDLSPPASFTWITVDLVRALIETGARITMAPTELSDTIEARHRDLLRSLMTDEPSDEVQVGWSHYWPPYQRLKPSGQRALAFVALNHLLARPTGEPSDAWLQQVAGDSAWKLAISGFCRDVLVQNGIDRDLIRVVNLGYAPEIDSVREPLPLETDRSFRFLTVTNSSDPVRFGTDLVIQAYAAEFTAEDDVCLVIKDYNPRSRRIQEYLELWPPRADYLYVPEFASRERMVGLYRACDAFVSAARGEGFGIKVLDALACGLPVVVPVFGGLRDFCNGPWAYPVDYQYWPADECVDVVNLKTKGEPVWCRARIQSIRQRMRHVLTHQGEAKRNGELGAGMAHENFAWHKVAMRLLDVAEEVVDCG